MIPNIVFIGLRYFFIALLFIFLAITLRVIYKDINAPLEPGSGRKSRKKGKRRDPTHLLVVVADHGAGTRHFLSGEMMIGRAENCGIRIEDNYVSQHHARIYQSDDSFHVEDVGSTNGTYVNGRKISYPLELRNGDRVKIGKTVFEFHQ